MNDATKATVVIVLRWIAVLPAALLGCLAARVLIVFLNRLTMAGYTDPDSFLSKVFVEWVGSVVMGAAAVFIGWYIAPTFKTQTAITLAGLLLLASGALLLIGFVQRDYWVIFAVVALNIGSIATACDIALRRSKSSSELGRPDN